MLRLRAALREFFPAALAAFSDLDAPDTLELLGRAPDPDTAAALSRAKIAAALGRARRRDPAAKAAQIQGILRGPQLRQPAPVQAAYAAIVSGQVRLIAALNAQIDELGEVVASHFGQLRDADIYASQPGLGTILSARILAEFGDDPHDIPEHGMSAAIRMRRRDQLCGGANECTRAASSRSGLMCLPYRGPQGVAARRTASGSKSGAEGSAR